MARNFEPGFFVEHFIKDMGIALAEARRMNLALPGLALAEQLYAGDGRPGHAQKGTHSSDLGVWRKCRTWIGLRRNLNRQTSPQMSASRRLTLLNIASTQANIGRAAPNKNTADVKL